MKPKASVEIKRATEVELYNGLDRLLILVENGLDWGDKREVQRERLQHARLVTRELRLRGTQLRLV